MIPPPTTILSTLLTFTTSNLTSKGTQLVTIIGPLLHTIILPNKLKKRKILQELLALPKLDKWRRQRKTGYY